jgi:uncharacterized protein YyaL (SSP411 family)
MAERLRDETSPYLLQHAGNPVDWWPWSDEAFAAAAERDVPVLLSVGYSACHWCHVMAHESFEDEHTAAIMNEHLVSIKVDREERPDVDSVYMTATQAMTGQGGWPMTVFMTPEREPFFCGTYFPRAQFQRLVLGVAQAWREDKAQVARQASQIAAALAERAGQPFPAAQPDEDSGDAAAADDPAAADVAAADDLAADDPAAVLAGASEAAVAVLGREFDARRGGFGGAPKFPPSMVLEFLLRHYERADGPDGAEALRMAEVTADAMARGGMYDQLAGGFARYSVDADWVVPHFEKMLYDNALLARLYAHLWRQTGSALARRVAEETCEWLIAELRTAEGGFASAIDADSDGTEGAFYVWTPDQLTAALGPEDGGYAEAAFGVTKAGTFEHGASVLQLRADPGDADRFARIRARLLAVRAHRTRPGRDDKVVAAWNGLAITALAETGIVADRSPVAGRRAPERRPDRADVEGWPGVRYRRRPRRLRLRRSRPDRTGERDRSGRRRGHRRGRPLAGAGRRTAGNRPGEIRDRNGGLLRHRRRQRAAHLPACGRRRRAQSIRDVRGRRRPAELLGPDRLGAASRRSRRRAGERAGPGGQVPARGRVGARRRRSSAVGARRDCRCGAAWSRPDGAASRRRPGRAARRSDRGRRRHGGGRHGGGRHGGGRHGGGQRRCTDPAAGWPDCNRRSPGRLRLPRLQLPRAGD